MRRPPPPRTALVLALVASACGGDPSGAGPDRDPTDAPAIDVLGPVLVNGQGERIRLRGVNRSGTEYM
ncbi:MAG: hypothetical protein R3314_03945, partial [Longimicrobiales bacterium]|nr:hypothetical protein [Longimicrobiales bacterium]